LYNYENNHTRRQKDQDSPLVPIYGSNMDNSNDYLHLKTKIMKAKTISEADYELINKWRLTGRIAFIHPRTNKICLNGISYNYATAILLIKDFLTLGL